MPKYKLTIEADTLDEFINLLGGTNVKPTEVTVQTSPMPTPAPAAVLETPPAPVEQPLQQPQASGEVDSSGLPHDERIHAKTKNTLGDGTWRKRRGVDDATYAQIEAELRGASQPPMPQVDQQPVQQPTMQQPVTQMPMTQQPQMTQQPVTQMPQVDQQPVQQPTMQQPVTQMPMTQQPQMTQQPVTQMPQVDQQPVTQQPEPTGQMDFHTFMQLLSAQMQKRDAAGQPLIAADYLALIAAELSTAFNSTFAAITDIQSNPQAITYAVQLFQRDGKWS